MAAIPRHTVETKEVGWAIGLGPTDPEHIRAYAGVGLMAKMPMIAVPIEGITQD